VQFEEVKIDNSSAPTVYRKYDLIPYMDSWELSWFDDFIVAKVPIIKEIPVTEKASIVVWKDGKDSFVLSQPINILSPEANPSILTILPPYPEGHIAKSSVIFIHGSGFGNVPGDLTLDLGQQKLYKIPCTWSSNFISATIPDYIPLEALDKVEDATLVLTTPEFKNNPFRMPVKVGPQMVELWINPLPKFGHIARPEGVDNWQVKSDPTGTFALVTHFPGCDDWWFSEGENDTDKYFENQELPPAFKMTGFLFAAINPHTWKDDITFFLEQLLNLASFPNCYQFYFDWIGMGVLSIFDPGIGQYSLSLMKEPTAEDLSTQVHFHNTCWGSMDGVPNQYMIGYRVYGPVKYLDQLK
jgi:hypothetical protein